MLLNRTMNCVFILLVHGVEYVVFVVMHIQCFRKAVANICLTE